jgi:hypothetical protein
VIREAKRSSYNTQISNSHNKIKTIWNIIKSETGRKMMKSDGFDTCKAKTDLFNNYFLTTAEKITYYICNVNQLQAAHSFDHLQGLTSLSESFKLFRDRHM